jgi:hypothetical protein
MAPLESSPQNHRKLPWILGAVSVFLLLLVGAGILCDRGWTELTEENYSAAREQWLTSAPSDYDMEIDVRGRQPARYRVEVRDGLARSAPRNGNPLRQVRTFETWSGAGMFETVGTDLEHLQLVKNGQATAATPRISVLVQFDETYGYPRRYLRVERGGSGGNPEVHWEVTEFTPISIRRLHEGEDSSH